MLDWQALWSLSNSIHFCMSISLLLTTVPIMYRCTVPVINKEPVDYTAFWHNGLEGDSQALLQCLPFTITSYLYFLSFSLTCLLLSHSSMLFLYCTYYSHPTKTSLLCLWVFSYNYILYLRDCHLTCNSKVYFCTYCMSYAYLPSPVVLSNYRWYIMEIVKGIW